MALSPYLPYLLAQVMIVHRLEDLVPFPSSVLLLGQGDGTEHRFSAALDHVLGESARGPGPGCRCWSLVTDGSESDILSPGRKPDQDKELTQACSRSTPVSIDYI